MKGDCAAMNATADVDSKFAPMNWCLSGMKAPVPPYVNKTFFMGFSKGPSAVHWHLWLLCYYCSTLARPPRLATSPQPLRHSCWC